MTTDQVRLKPDTTCAGDPPYAGVPSVSIVVTARHDHYGGDASERIVKPLLFNAARLSERGIEYEVILVEWDPIPGRQYLSEVLSAQLPSDVTRNLRRIIVAPEYQPALTQSPRPFYFEYLAKNVGIRRAAAPYVLVSNIDIMFGRAVIDTLAGGALVPGTIYRSPRYDVKIGVDQTGLTWDALEDASNHATRAVLRPPLYSHGSGDFLLADRDTFHRLRGFNEVYRAARVGIDLNFLTKAYGAGHRIEEIAGPVYHINHVGSYRMKAAAPDSSAESSWGITDWHARHVTYNNPDGWGLGDAPSRQLADGTTFLDFDWRAVPPLVELRRVTLPSRQAAAESL